MVGNNWGEFFLGNPPPKEFFFHLSFSKPFLLHMCQKKKPNLLHMALYLHGWYLSHFVSSCLVSLSLFVSSCLWSVSLSLFIYIYRVDMLEIALSTADGGSKMTLSLSNAEGRA